MNYTNIPFNQIVKFGQANMVDNPLFNISWILGRFCNYKCSYCWPYARSDKVDHQPLEVYKSTVDEIKRQARVNGFNQFHWSFSGGEPTAYKQLLELIKHLDEIDSKYQSIHMTTNLSPSLTWWRNWHNVTCLLQRRSITASYHTEHAKELEFGDKCLQLIEDLVHVTINQVMVPDLFFETLERCERFRKRGINVTLKPQSNDTATAIVDGYTPDMIKIMQSEFEQQINGEEMNQIVLYDNLNNTYHIDQAERFNALGFNQFTDWTCNAGYQSVIIMGNEVKRGYSCRDLPIGTLEKFDLRIKPPKCVTPKCVSSADSKIPKCKIK
jgi:organic radical activating enzyme